MAASKLAEVSEQIQKFWAPVFMKELRESLLLGALVNRDYQGEIRGLGDTVYVSQVNAPTGQLKDVGVDADSFDSDLLVMKRSAIVANKRAVAAYEMEDLIMLQSQLGAQDSEIRAALLHAVSKQINDYLYTLVAPSASAPDHTITGVTDFNAAQLGTVRQLAAQAKWGRDKPWYLLLDPQYYSDMLNASTITSSDFVGDDKPVVGGQIVTQRYGFSILEDNSRPADRALAFHPDFMAMVMQMEPRFKLSDLHSNKQFGMVLSVDIVFGAKQMTELGGDKKVITVTA